MSALEISSSKTENGTEIGTILFCSFIRDFDSQFGFIPSSINRLIGFWVKISSNLSNLCSETFIVLKIQFLLWAFSEQNQTSSSSIVSCAIYSWLYNWLRVKKSAETVKFQSWKFHLQKPKMGQRLGQSDFTILFGILIPSILMWFHTVIN